MVNAIHNIVASFGYVATVRRVDSNPSAKLFNTLYEVKIDAVVNDTELLELHSAIRELKVNFSIEVPNV